MADPLYALTADDVRFLRELKRKELTGENVPRLRYQRKGLALRHMTCRWAKTGSAIPARSGVTLGSGEVTLYTVNEDDELEATTDTKDALNGASTEVAAATYVIIELIGDKWVVIWEDCG